MEHERPLDTFVTAVCMAGYVSLFHVGLGLLLSLLPVLAISRLDPGAYPLTTFDGMLIGVPGAYALWRLVRTERDWHPAHGVIAGTLIGALTLFIGAWVWIGFEAIGIANVSYRYTYFAGQALIAALPLYVNSIERLAQRLIARD